MSALLLLATCLGAGIIVGRLGKAPPGLASGISWFAINIALPALALHLVSQLQLDLGFWYLVASQWLVAAGAWAVVVIAARLLGWSRSRTGAVALVAGLGNTAFMGYPLIEAVRGHEALGLAVVADQAGCFVALATYGVVITAVYAGKQVSALSAARRVLVFPPFIAFCLGIVAAITGGIWGPLDSVFERLGATLTPIAVFAVGVQFRVRIAAGEGVAMAVALGWKLVVAPLLVLGLGLLLHVRWQVLDIAVLQSAMAPMISAALLAEQDKLDPHLATAILGVGMIASMFTVPAIAWALPMIFH